MIPFSSGLSKPQMGIAAFRFRTIAKRDFENFFLTLRVDRKNRMRFPVGSDPMTLSPIFNDPMETKPCGVRIFASRGCAFPTPSLP